MIRIIADFIIATIIMNNKKKDCLNKKSFNSLLKSSFSLILPFTVLSKSDDILADSLQESIKKKPLIAKGIAIVIMLLQIDDAP